MRILVDTNVLLDYLLLRQPFAEDATKLIVAGYKGLVRLDVCDISITNIAYITRKDIPREQFYQGIERLLKYVGVVSVGRQIVELAIMERWEDFEDCIQYFSALKNECDCIVTRNPDDFKKADIPVYTPTEFIDHIL